MLRTLGQEWMATQAKMYLTISKVKFSTKDLLFSSYFRSKLMMHLDKLSFFS